MLSRRKLSDNISKYTLGADAENLKKGLRSTYFFSQEGRGLGVGGVKGPKSQK